MINDPYDILKIEGLIFHYTRYECLKSIFQHGLLSRCEMRKKGIPIPDKPQIAQRECGEDKISVNKFDNGKINEGYDREEEICKHAFGYSDMCDVLLVIHPDVETTKEGRYYYEHTVKDRVDVKHILAVCYKKDNKYSKEIKKMCAKYNKKHYEFQWLRDWDSCIVKF